jgi:peptidoglycan/LPS O-acetylase OafA/YrhL
MACGAAAALSMSPSTHPEYRPDIDGLRAIAVLFVVAFHAFPSLLPGGFVGVDVFFVISGFLISGIILKGLRDGSFSFRDFYGRRISRIFPALLLVLPAVALAGWLLLFPSEFQRLGAHLMAAAGFVSNFLLWSQSGYFEPASEYKPLLHLWSLGIEEQFYIFFPLLLALLWRTNRVMFWIAVLTGFSFLLNLIGTRRDPLANFYAPVTRAWELLVGAALAYVSVFRPEMLRRITGRPGAPGLLALAGVAALCIAACLLDKGSRQFPGWWALLPTGGTLLIIAAGPGAWLNRTVLAHPASVWVGLISYPLYLWHWPLLSYLAITSNSNSPAAARAAAVALAFLLAWLTFVMVEKPILQRRWPRVTAPGLAALMGVIAVVGLAISQLAPPTRLNRSGELTPLVKALDDWEFPGEGVVIKGKVPGTVLFVGDSFIQQYYGRLKAVVDASDKSYSVKYAGLGGCPPLPNVSRIANPGGCIRENNAAYAEAMTPEVKRVVFGSAWHYFYPITDTHKAGDPRKFEHDAMVYARDDASRRGIAPGSPGFTSAFREFEAVVAGLVKGGKQVYIVLPTPISDSLNPRAMIDRWANKAVTTTGIAKSVYLQSNAPVIAELAGISARTGAALIDPAADLCGNGFCAAFFGKDPIYQDIGHIRPYFVRGHITVFDKVLIAN